MFEVRGYMWITMLDDDYETILASFATLAEAEENVKYWHEEFGFFTFIVNASD